MEGAGDGVGVEDDVGGDLGFRAGDGLGVELGDPPVVFAGRVGGDEGDVVGVGRPVELVDVEIGGGEEVAGASGGVDAIDALDLYAVFADDAVPGRHGVEGSGVAGGVLDEEEGDGFAVGGEGWLLNFTDQVGELLDLARGLGPEEDLDLIGLRSVSGAGGEEGEGFAVGGPDGGAVGAVGGVGDLDELGGDGVGDLGEVEGGAVGGAEGPGHGRAVGRDGYAAGLGDVG